MLITNDFIIYFLSSLQEVHEHQPSLGAQVIQHLLSALAHQLLP